jgi:outer membrane beta-barrel protein
MRFLAIAALLFASAAHAQAAWASAVHSLVIHQYDEDEDDTDASEQPSGPATTAPALGAGSDAPLAPVSTRDPRAQELVSGAPLYNPNVAVHIVEKKQFANKGKHELALYPAMAQVNGKFTQHFGTALSYTYHAHENFGFQFTPLFNWYNNESAFNQELIEKVREEAQAASSVLLNYGALAGVEVAPIYGKFAWYDTTLAHYSLVLNGGAGFGSSRHQLKQKNDSGPATFGDTGMKTLASIGGGFRVLIKDRFAIRLEVRDIVYTARMEKVNGCDFQDLTALRRAFNEGRSLGTVGVDSGCRVDTFEGTNEAGYNKAHDLNLARNLVEKPSSDVLNLVSFFGGLSFLF